MCLVRFSKKEILEEHYNGVEDGPTRIEKCQVKGNQQKAPFVIYADFESLFQKIEGPEQQR